MGLREVAKMLKAEGWYGPQNTVYHIEFRVRRLRENGQPVFHGVTSREA
jgi:hypothetical protein